MQIQCECGKFKAELTGFPKNTPGRVACYCDDCQTYLHHIGRTDLLDSAGGTEIVPVYPCEVKILQGAEFLKCLRLYPNGMDRWLTTCCNTPVGNGRPGFPWVGVLHRVYNVKDPTFLERTLGPIKSRILGRFAKGTPPSGTSSRLAFKDVRIVTPFLLKGFFLRKAKNSPFYEKDGKTPAKAPDIVPKERRISLRCELGFE